MKGEQFELDFHSAAYIASDGGDAQLMHQFWGDVGRHTDVALSAAQHERHSGGVIA